jgi:ribosomal protein S12 methylthiotransferase
MGGSLEDRTMVSEKSTYIPEYDTPRFRLTPPHSAYIKIAEGCNHTCSFCVIPQIRGRHRSRSMESIVREATMLVESGVKEINLIAQDSTYYGMDRWKDGERATPRSKVDSSKGDSLASLLRALNEIPGDFWIRILYTHPAHWSDELIETIAACPKVARYVDIPLQHISDRMLAAMQRQTDGDYIRNLLRKMRAGIPGLAIRTTFISGFPGETEDDHRELMDFIEEFRFERAGIFTYSREEGTKAYKLPHQVHHATKTRRSNEASVLLARIADEIGQEQIGKTIRVLVESPGVARTEWDAPDIDGSVSVPEDLPVGQFAMVKVTDAVAYDLQAEKA